MSEIPLNEKNHYVLSFMRTRMDCYYPSVSVDFTPLQTFNQTVHQILPKFNSDANYFTSAFINPYQQSRVKENPAQHTQKEREKFAKKVQLFDNSMDQQNPQFNPRDDNYCCICKSGLKCYWKHTNSAGHKRKIKHNKFNGYIHQLCQNYTGKVSPPLAADIPSSRIVNKKKKISKKGKKSKKGEQSIVYTKEDFIVRIPSDLWDKEVQNINCNISTNGLNSTEQEQLKL